MDNEDFSENSFNFIKNNYMYAIFFLIYFILTWLMLGASLASFFIVVIFYSLSVWLAFSPLGEKILRFINGVRSLETKREKHYLIPLFDDVYTDTRNVYQNLRDDIEIGIIDSININACALGKKTVAVTRGAIEALSEEELQGLIAHELGHIAHGDTKAILLMTVGNGIFTILIVIAQIVINVLNSLFEKRHISGFLMLLLKILFHFTLFYAVNLGQIILSVKSRQNEYRADQFAYEVGYGEDLVSTLYILHDIAMSDNRKVIEKLKASHPHTARRIGRLESMIDEDEAMGEEEEE